MPAYTSEQGKSGIASIERQAMDIMHRLGRATAEDVRRELPSSPSYSAVRSLLSILVEKGLLKVGKESRRYIYEPALPRGRVRDAAVMRLLKTFFDGSPGKLVASLLEKKDRTLKPDELEAIRTLLDQHQSKSIRS